MGTVVAYEQVVPLLRRQFAALGDLCEPLDASGWDTPTCLPGWTVKDVMSHIIGTESMLLGEPSPAVDTSHLQHMRNPIAEANELWVESMRTDTGETVLERFRTVTERRLAVLDAMTQTDFDEPSWTPASPDETYGRFMRIRLFDCFAHELDIRDALGEPDPTDADRAAMALAEPVATLGYIVGRVAAIPAGNSVGIELHGQVTARYRIEVTDRARLVDIGSPAEAPTATIRLDALLFLRLAGGRLDAVPLLGTEVAMDGDVGLATQLATRLAYMI